MTPEQWFAAEHPDALLAFVNPRPEPPRYELTPPATPETLRRLRLFGCACARQVWDVLPTDARSAVSLSERVAESRAALAVLRAAAVRISHGPATFQQLAVNAAGWASAGTYQGDPMIVWEPAEAARCAARAVATRAAGPAPPGHTRATDKWHAAWVRAYDAARAVQAAYARDIFPPPEYAPHFDPAWLTSTVAALARQMDQSGDFSAAPILADALQDAGCDDEAALLCCRVTGNVHVRGNWVVDLVLGRG